jgi:hypothetical protein
MRGLFFSERNFFNNALSSHYRKHRQINREEVFMKKIIFAAGLSVALFSTSGAFAGSYDPLSDPAVTDVATNRALDYADDQSGWDVSGMWDAASDFFTTSEPARGQAPTTTVAAPTNTQYQNKYVPPSTSGDGLSVCQNRNAVTQQSAAQYQVQPVANAY